MNKIVIVGGGFAGTWAAMSAAATRAKIGSAETEITLLSDAEHLSIRPRLYEKPSSDHLVPLRPLMDEVGVRFEQVRVDAIMEDRVLAQDSAFRFDRLVLSSGSHLVLPDTPNAGALGYSIDTAAEAKKLDAHLARLDFADVADSTVVVVGASFTGIELVTNLRARLGSNVRLVLMDQADAAGQSLGSNLSPLIAKALKELDVEVMTNVSLARLDQRMATLMDGSTIETSTIVFATGLRASGLTGYFSEPLEADGRIAVRPDLRVADHSHVFAAGDVARAKTDEKHSTVMSCQHAIPMGTVAGRNAVLDVLGHQTVPYAQAFYATCLDLGPAGAVFTHGWDRQVQKTGADGSAMKQEINTKWIYPPDPQIGAAKIFEIVSQSVA